ncbi:hypothetical protein EJ06DRAFT_188895 [Trichodelitschia bisporula]|uniref:MJ1316 RNA cyclic group end recognition domain-containing protein n=1 Tax=Trichodelitschia bisporula TaxID=703511 RepID=A0A6G1I7S5_9PEZI|nr:hypothetical protein EJ06DRAFT_188895 [Trichodelitschia bisporula]
MASKQPDIARTARNFIHKYSFFVRVDISCKQYPSQETGDPHHFVEHYYTMLQNFCKTLRSGEDGEPPIVSSAMLFPRLFTPSASDAAISAACKQDRGTFLIGVEPVDTDVARFVDRMRMSVNMLVQQIYRDKFIRDYEPTPAQPGVFFVGELELGILEPDTVMLKRDETTESRRSSGDWSELEDYDLPEPPAANHGKLAPGHEIVTRLKWDPEFNGANYLVVYEDRHDGLMDRPVLQWLGTQVEEEAFVPQHRIRSIQEISTGRTVWHRAARVDLISG